MAHHVEMMLELQKRGAITFDYGNNIRGQAKDKRGVENAFDFPGFVPAYIRPLFCEGKGPFRFVALSGDPNDIAVCDEKLKELFPNNTRLLRWLTMAKEKIAFQGLPARICWLGMGDREIAGVAFNELVKEGKVNMGDSFCYFRNSELWLKSLHISVYKNGSYANHEPMRLRKLLLTKKEIKRLENKIKEKGLTIIPYKIQNVVLPKLKLF